MLSKTTRSALLLLSLLAPALAHADDGDPVVGRKKALQCQACHGMDGIAKIPEAANLAGQSTIYLTSALNDYKTGARKNDMMSTIAPTLSDADIADLAAYYSAIEITAKVPGH
jgi:cytochrome c553